MKEAIARKAQQRDAEKAQVSATGNTLGLANRQRNPGKDKSAHKSRSIKPKVRQTLTRF
jgi:hypothetical protein